MIRLVVLTSMVLTLAARVGTGSSIQEGESTGGVPVGGIVAVVNDTPITLRDLEMRIRQILKSDPRVREKPFAEIQMDALVSLVSERMLLRAARSAEVEIPPEEIESRIEDLRKSAGSESEFKTALSAEGMSPADLRDFFQENLTSQQYISGYLGLGPIGGPKSVRAGAEIEPSPREIRRYYRRNRETEFTIRPSARLRRIYVSNSRHDGPDGAEAFAASLRERALSGESFEALAREASDLDRDAGGDIGEVDLAKGDGLPEEILEFARRNPAGSISGLFGGDPGYYFVKIESKSEERTIPFEEAQERIRLRLRAELQGQSLDRLVDRLMREAVIWPVELEREIRSAR